MQRAGGGAWRGTAVGAVGSKSTCTGGLEVPSGARCQGRDRGVTAAMGWAPMGWVSMGFKVRVCLCSLLPKVFGGGVSAVGSRWRLGLEPGTG